MLFSDESATAEYSLSSIVNHYGRFEFGHCTSFCKNNDSWYEFDDDKISRMYQTHHLVTNAAYMMFYVRENII